MTWLVIVSLHIGSIMPLCAGILLPMHCEVFTFQLIAGTLVFYVS